MTQVSPGTDGTRTSSPPQGSPAFVTTHWSVVVSATGTDSTQARCALDRLCQEYWYPLYAYIRRRGHAAADAEDLTQEFFRRILEHRWLDRADQSKGRFRTFLLTALQRFLANEWDKSHAQKRGGGVQVLPIQIATAETRYGVEPADHRSPEQAFEQRWALTVLDEVLKKLAAEISRQHSRQYFETLKPCLLGDRSSQPYAQLSARLGMTETALKVAVHRLRQRYRELLRLEIAQTVASPQEVEEEMRYLLNALTAA